MSLRSAELVNRGLAEPPVSGAAGMFALSQAGRLTELLEGAGFGGVRVESIGFEMRFDSFDSYWETACDLGVEFARLVDGLEAAALADLQSALRRALLAFGDPHGALAIPARALLAAADA